MGKILRYSEIRNLRNKTKKRKTVFMSGAFDLFHYGHFLALKKASRLGQILIVQIDGNKLVKKRKGDSRPFLDETSRAQIVSSLNFVSYVFISNFPSENRRTLMLVSPDVYIRAILPNESDEDRLTREEKISKKMKKGKILWLSQTPEVSTTKIISALESKLNWKMEASFS